MASHPNHTVSNTNSVPPTNDSCSSLEKVRSAAPDGARHKQAVKAKGDRWLGKISKLTEWMATSEPSAQAFKQHQQDVFRKAGIRSRDDEQASLKLHAPIGEVPPEAIKPAGGPTPEELVQKRREERRKVKQQAGYAKGNGSVIS